MLAIFFGRHHLSSSYDDRLMTDDVVQVVGFVVVRGGGARGPRWLRRIGCQTIESVIDCIACDWSGKNLNDVMTRTVRAREAQHGLLPATNIGFGTLGC